jgi:hypothetical protein
MKTLFFSFLFALVSVHSFAVDAAKSTAPVAATEDAAKAPEAKPKHRHPHHHEKKAAVAKAEAKIDETTEEVAPKVAAK